MSKSRSARIYDRMNQVRGKQPEEVSCFEDLKRKIPRLEVTYFGLKGKAVPEGEDYFSKVVLNLDTNKGTYFVRMFGGNMRNPWEVTGEISGPPGIDKYKDVEVSKDTFDKYQRFLKTKNALHLRAAEKGLADETW